MPNLTSISREACALHVAGRDNRERIPSFVGAGQYSVNSGSWNSSPCLVLANLQFHREWIFFFPKIILADIR